MLKKKNIAMMMAVATAATTAVPAFAAGLDGQVIGSKDEQSVAQLKSEIEALLNTKYATDKTLLDKEENAGKSVYTISVDFEKDSENIVELKNIEQLEVALAKLNDEDNKFLNIKVVDNGHKEFNGKIVDWKQGTYVAKDAVEDKGEKNITELLTISGKKAVTDVKKVNDNTVELTLKNNTTPLTVKVGDSTLNLDNPTFKQDNMGSYLDKDGNVIAGVTKDDALDNEKTVVTGFESDRLPLVEKDKEDVKNFGVDYQNVQVTKFEANELFDNSIERLTSKGNQLKQYIDKYNAVEEATENDARISNVTNGALTITFPVDKTEDMKKKVKSNEATGSFAQIVVSGSNNELNGLKKALDSDSKIKILAGADRYTTAIEVSKKAFNSGADTVVLVSGTALADGLTATPFAASKNAPILLTDGKTISDDTMKEIERLEAKNVYLIGGENTISKSVETKLKAKNITPERISGDDRFETSLAIAEEMAKDTQGKKVFIAGGYAEADAMSIAPIAAGKDEVAPIILANEKNGLSKDAVKFIATDKTVETYIIGGESNAPESIKDQLKKAEMEKATVRLSGDDRQGTNAAVINKFASKEELANLYVAKSDNKGLVDSLAAGVLAGQTNSPIVLATNDLSVEQQSVLKAKNPEVTSKVQIGEGVAAQVWSTIKSIFEK